MNEQERIERELDKIKIHNMVEVENEDEIYQMFRSDIAKFILDREKKLVEFVTSDLYQMTDSMSYRLWQRKRNELLKELGYEKENQD